MLDPNNSSSKPGRVKFSHVQIRDYKQIVGDHPDCTVGAPVSLSWEYKELGSRSVDDYEASRGNYRPTATVLHMSEFRRESILKNAVGASDEEIKKAIVQVRKVQRQREKTFIRDSAVKDRKSLGEKLKIAFSRIRKPVNYF